MNLAGDSQSDHRTPQESSGRSGVAETSGRSSWDCAKPIATLVRSPIKKSATSSSVAWMRVSTQVVARVERVSVWILVPTEPEDLAKWMFLKSLVQASWLKRRSSRC